MKRLIQYTFIFLVAVPLCLWLLVLGIGVMQPEQVSTPIGKETTVIEIPRDKPREGYEIIYPYAFNGGPDRSTFYYVSNKRQVVYRYDEQRYLELQGKNCEGLMWYHDDEHNIHTRIDETFFTVDKLPKFAYFNPGREYIAIPTQDLTAVMFSLDGGKTFIKGTVTSHAAVAGDEIERFIGVDDEPLTVNFEDVDQYMRGFTHTITISGNTGYFILKNGDVIFGETVFYDRRKNIKQDFYMMSFPPYDKSIKFGGRYWGIYHHPAYIERIEGAKAISVEPYQGWDKIRCEIGVES